MPAQPSLPKRDSREWKRRIVAKEMSLDEGRWRTLRFRHTRQKVPGCRNLHNSSTNDDASEPPTDLLVVQVLDDPSKALGGSSIRRCELVKTRKPCPSSNVRKATVTTEDTNPVLLGFQPSGLRQRAMDSGYDPIRHCYRPISLTPRPPLTSQIESGLEFSIRQERFQRTAPFMPSGRLRAPVPREALGKSSTAGMALTGTLGLSPRELPSLSKREQSERRFRTSADMRCILMGSEA